MQMSLDKSVEHLVAVVYDWSGTEETGFEPAVLATARVPFSGAPSSVKKKIKKTRCSYVLE
jgi:hypothetical protein